MTPKIHAIKKRVDLPQPQADGADKGSARLQISLANLDHRRKVQVTSALNLLADYLAIRDVASLSQTNIKHFIGTPHLDALILFGGSTLEGNDAFQSAMTDDVAEHYIISGGIGHTTDRLRRQVNSEGFDFHEGTPEAVLHSALLSREATHHVPIIETQSTNCGNNVTNTLQLLKDSNINARTIGIIQDASMQRRMAAGFALHAPEIHVLNYAAYRAVLTVGIADLRFSPTPRGMWSVEDYAALLIGEIPRLHDTKEGYGPNGKHYISHVKVPEQVLSAYHFLAQLLNFETREAIASTASRTTQQRKHPSSPEHAH